MAHGTEREKLRRNFCHWFRENFGFSLACNDPYQCPGKYMINFIQLFTHLFSEVALQWLPVRDFVRFPGCPEASAWNNCPIVVGHFLVAGAGGTFGFIGMMQRVESIDFRNRQCHILRNCFSALKLQNPHAKHLPCFGGLSRCSFTQQTQLFTPTWWHLAEDVPNVRLLCLSAVACSILCKSRCGAGITESLAA